MSDCPKCGHRISSFWGSCACRETYGGTQPFSPERADYVAQMFGWVKDADGKWFDPTRTDEEKKP